MITCPRCGFQAPDGTPWCPRCGYGKPQQPPIPQPIPPAQQPPNQRPDPDAPVSIASDEGRKILSQWAQEKKQEQLDQDPLPQLHPSEPPASKSSNKLFSRFFLFSAVIAGLLLLFALNSERGRYKDQADSYRQTVIALRSDLSGFQQTATAFAAGPSATPTAVPTPTITPTPKAAVPALCKDKQTDLIRLAGVLDAEGHPYPGEYDPDRNACIYTISDTNSFLNMDNFGYLTILHDEADHPYGAVVEIYYKDNDQIRELIKDWGATALAYVDPDTDVLSAMTIILTASTSGFTTTGNYALTAKLDTDSMLYQIGILDMRTIE